MKLSNFLFKILAICLCGMCFMAVEGFGQKIPVEVDFFRNPNDREFRDKLIELRDLAIDDLEFILNEKCGDKILLSPAIIEEALDYRKKIKIKYNGEAQTFVFGEIKKRGTEFKINLYLYKQTGKAKDGTVSIEQIGQSLMEYAYGIGKLVVPDSRFRYNRIKELLDELPLELSEQNNLIKELPDRLPLKSSEQQPNNTKSKKSGNYIEIQGTRGENFFPMGSNIQSDGKKRLSEEKIHFVQVYDFEIGINEVTNLQYCEFLNDTALIALLEEDKLTVRDLVDFTEDSGIYITKANKYAHRPLRPNQPVIMVSWDGARLYAKWWSQKTEETYRLPTESEWEYAASMTQSEEDEWDDTTFRYSGSNRIKDVAWYKGNTNQIKSVNDKRKDNNGIYNMTGNVAEWCLDDYEENNYKSYLSKKKGARKSNKPIKHFGSKQKVVRGGSYKSQKHYCRNAYRGHRFAKGKYEDVGFRLVRLKK